MNMMEYIDRSNRTGSVEELVELFSSMIAAYGYTKFCSYTTRGLRPETHKTTADDAHYNTEFFNYYLKNKCRDADPIYRLIQRSRTPFSWAQVAGLALTKRQRAVMDMRAQARMLSGLSMAIRSADHETIGLSLSSPREDARHDQQAMTELFAVSNQFYLRRAQLLGFNDLELSDISLSPREKEILIWCSHGKSNSVIASILAISEKTVEYHLSSAFQKLDASSRTAAVLRAVNLRLITP